QLFLWGNKLVGVDENGMNLDVYVSDRSIPTSTESRSAFRGELDRFIESVSTGIFQPTAQINMKALFEAGLRDQTEIVIEELRQVGSDLEIKARRTDASDARFKVSLTEELSIGKRETVSIGRVRPAQ
ncbi:MAG: hypothetical protein L0Z50_15965, partial [Verrucomicrobiales bacterium]|nr:hypothetical protein [Verrucomicrobiales bacterium]